MKSLHFKKEDLKTSQLRIFPSYEYKYNGIAHERKEVFKGYSCSCNLKLDFGFDTSLLAKLITALSSLKSAPTFRIEFTLKNPEALKKELLTNAVENAKAKATILAEAGEVQLGQIIDISYAWGEENEYIRSSTRYENRCLSNKSCSSVETAVEEINPEDIKLSDSVSIVWEIL